MANFINAHSAFHYAYEVVHYFKLPASQGNISSTKCISLGNKKMNEKYDKIINMKRPVSGKYQPMSNHDRAAQFAPYSALSGYEDAVEETARLTDSKTELDEYEKERINNTLTSLLSAPPDTKISLTFFRKDKKKKGGAYVTVTGEIGKIDEIKQEITLIGGMPISFDNILDINEI